MQTGRTTQAAAPARFRNVAVGVGYGWIRANAKRWPRACSHASRPTRPKRWSRATNARSRASRTNAIHQNVDVGRNVAIRVRAIVDGRTGVAVDQRSDDRAASTRRRCARAVEMALLAPRDPAALELAPARRRHRRRGAYVEATAQAIAASCAPELRRESSSMPQAASCVVGGLRRRRRAAASRSRIPLGADAVVRRHRRGVNVKMNGADSTGFRRAVCVRRWRTRRPARSANVAARKARDSAQPGRGRSRRVDGRSSSRPHSANCSIISSDHFSAQSLDEGSSFLCDGLDRRMSART